jgi:hypothetical protein
MSALAFAFAAKRAKLDRSAGFAGAALPFENTRHTPCIPPAILRGMVDRILTRARVERDNREEAQPSR